MSKIAFFRQQRVDGAIRSGILLDDELVFHELKNENVEEPDPVLQWFVNVAAEGDDLPNDPEEAREWLMSHAAEISGLLVNEGQKISAGIDHLSWPIHYETRIAEQRVMRIGYAAMQGVAAREMGEHLIRVAREFGMILPALHRLEPAPSLL